MFSDAKLQRVNALQTKALFVGGAAILAAVVGAAIAAPFSATGIDKLFQPFLVAFIFWLGLGVGCLAAVMLHHLCGGGWSFLIQRICEAGTRTLPLLALIGAVVMFGGMLVSGIYPWTDPAVVDASKLIGNKVAFLNKGAFVAGFAVYFGIWFLLSFAYNRWSDNLDKTGDQTNVVWMKRLAGPGLILYVLTMTFAATHWIMSLEPEWFSTIFGAWMMSGYALMVVAFATIVLSYIADEPSVSPLVQTKHFHHLGNFLLGFTVFWTYISFSQFLIIWSGNLPEVIGWHINRQGGLLNLLTVILIVFHWFIPMMILLIRRNKTNVRTLRKIAYWIIAMRFVDVYWNIAPSYPDHHQTLNIVTLVLTLLATVGVGGVWLWAFLGQLKQRPLTPQQDPREESLFLKHDEAHSHA